MEFKRIFDEHFAPVLAFAKKLVKDPVVARDIVIDAMIKLADRIKKQGPPDEIKPYLYTIVKHDCSKYLEDPGRKIDYRDDMDDFGNGAGKDLAHKIEDRLITVEIHRLLWQEVEKFDEPRRQIFRLTYLENKTSVEVARQLAPLSDDTVRQHLTRGRQQLLLRLEKYNIDKKVIKLLFFILLLTLVYIVQIVLSGFLKK